MFGGSGTLGWVLLTQTPSVLPRRRTRVHERRRSIRRDWPGPCGPWIAGVVVAVVAVGGEHRDHLTPAAEAAAATLSLRYPLVSVLREADCDLAVGRLA